MKIGRYLLRAMPKTFNYENLSFITNLNNSSKYNSTATTFIQRQLKKRAAICYSGNNACNKVSMYYLTHTSLEAFPHSNRSALN